MKKLLTILALALALCMLCGVALAADFTLSQADRWKEYGTKFGDEFTDGTADLMSAVNAEDRLIGGYDVNLDQAELQQTIANALDSAVHAEYTRIWLYGEKFKVEEKKTYVAVADAADEDVKNGLYVWDDEEDDGNGGKGAYRKIKDGDHPADMYALKLDYDYTWQQEGSFAVYVMLKPHDKLGEATVSGDKITYKCSCGKEWEAVDKPTTDKCTHIWSWEPVKGKEATCLIGGKEIQTCTVCGLTTGAERDYGPIDHTWEYEKETLIAPVCREASTAAGGSYYHEGSIYKHCTVCGAREKENVSEDHYRYLMVAVLGKTWREADEFDVHKWSGKGVLPATCDRPAQYVQICERCHTRRYPGMVPNSEPLEPHYVAVNVPTCKTLKNDSVITFKCTNCGSASSRHPAFEVKVEDMLHGVADAAEYMKTHGELELHADRQLVYEGHDEWVEDDSAVGGHWEFVVEYGSDEIALDVTIAHGGKLTVTKDTKEHTLGGGKVENATCEDWIYVTKTCDLCKNKAIEVKDHQVAHKFGEWKAQLVTDTVTQWVRVCSVCNTKETSYSATAPEKECEEGKHNYEPRWLSYEANCANTWVPQVIDGKTTIKTPGVCTICGKINNDYYYVVEHEWEEIPGLAKAGSCTVKAIKTYQCKVCDAIIAEETDFVHDWDEGKITKKATKTADGVKTFTCKKCGATKEEAVKYELAAAKYDVKNAVYDGESVTGKVNHVDDTKTLDKIYARVTFFYADGTFAVMVVPVEDGEFYAGATTATVHVAVQIVDNAKQITPPATDAIYGSGSAKMN